MFDWKRWILPGLVTIAILTIAAAYLRAGIVETDLSTRVQDAFQARHDWAQVEADGRDLILRGPAPSQEAIAEALEMARQVRGVRVANSQAELLALQSPYRLSLTRSDGKVTMEGFVPGQSARDTLHAIVAASVPDAELVDRLALAGGAPEHFLPLVGYGAAQLAGLSEGVIELVDTRLTVRGTAISSRAYENVLDALDAGLPGGELDVVDIAPPRISPYVWKLERQGEAVTLTGNAPSRTARETAAANLRNAIVDAQVDNRLEIASGLDENVDWRAATDFLVRQLASFKTATIEVSDGSVTLSGAAAAPAEFDALLATFNRDLPAGLTLASADMSRPVVDPFTWSLDAGDDGAITIDGYVPDLSVAERLRDAVRLRIGEGTSIRDDQQVASGAPQGFETAAGAIVGVIGRLPAMHATLSGNNLTVEGEALTGIAANEIREQIAAALPSGFELKTGIAMRPPGEALAPQDCEASLSDDLRAASILFETGSSEISGASLGLLDRLTFTLRRCPDTRFEVGGHTDSDGTEEANLELSTTRARAVVDRLVRAGVRYSRVVAKGYGESQPVADNATPEGRARNRRIEFRIIR